MSQPLVSILIPTYKPRHFEIALTSALAQTYANKEIIVSDDCPTEQIAEICRSYPTVNYSRNPVWKPNSNLLRMINMAQGEYVKYLLDDDLLHPLCLTRMVDAFEAQKDAALVFSPRDLIDTENRIIGRPRNIKAAQEITRLPGRQLAHGCIINLTNIIGEFSTVMFRRRDVWHPDGSSVFVNYHGDAIAGLTDVAAWLALCERGDALYIAEPLSYFRIHQESNTSNRATPNYRAAVVDWLVFARHAAHSPDFTPAEKAQCLQKMRLKLEQKLPLFADLVTEIAEVEALQRQVAGVGV